MLRSLLARLVLALDHHLLGLGDGSCRIQTLRTGLRAIHDRMTTIQTERILEFVQPLTGGVIATVDQPAIRRQQGRWA